MKTTLLLFSLLIIGCLSSSAQSFFKSVPKISEAKELSIFESRNISTDSTLNAWRPITNIAAYAYPGNILMAGAGAGYQHLKYDYNNQKWICQWSVNALGFAGGSVAPSTLASIASVGILAGVDNNLVMFGPSYNFGLKQFAFCLSIGINLNN